MLANIYDHVAGKLELSMIINHSAGGTCVCEWGLLLRLINDAVYWTFLMAAMNESGGGIWLYSV
jgi:hypothetical protein